ncbi:MAG TPA: hypothetical protein PLA90_14760, partial [Candidatus Sumerlaeota bacterium]|nr:hypothetical protein [Candidatus Sumerlaeota bacterium]
MNLAGGGRDFLLGLRTDGSLQAWKYAGSIPEPNENFVAIAAATILRFNYIGLKSDGSVVTWGGFYSRRAVPEPNREFVAVAAGTYHYLGLKSDGSVVAWGDNSGGKCRVPEPNTGFIAIAAANNYSVGLKSDGSIVVWGWGSSGRFITPTPNRDFVAISAGYEGYWGLKSGGSVVGVQGYHYMTPLVPNQGFVALGADESDLAFGDGGKLQVTLTPPEAVAAGARWRLVGEGVEYWGSWRESGTTVTRAVGTCQVEFFDDLPGWSAVATTQTVTIQKDGLTSVTGAYVPTQTWHLSVASLNGSVAVSPVRTNYRDGSTVTLIAKPDPGYRFVSWSGNITTTTQNPLVLTMDSTKTLVANFELYECYLTVEVGSTTGTVTVSPNLSAYPVGSTVTLTAIPAPDWRFQRWGGDVSEEQRGNNPLVVTMDTDKTIRAHFAAPELPEIGIFRINNGAIATVNPTVTLPNFCDWVTSSTYLYMASESADFTNATWKPYVSTPLFTLSAKPGMKTVYFKVKYASRNEESEVKSDTIMLYPPKALVAWGRGDEGQRAFSSPGEKYVAVSGGMAHSLGLKPDGSIVAWGENTKGQCDVPTSNTGFVALSAGGAHNLALRADGSIVAWGDNASGQCDLPTSNTGFVAVAAGTDHSLGLREDGTVVAWGNNEAGQCAVPEPNSGFVAISAGGLHSLGLKVDGSIVAWGGNDSGQCTVPEPNSGFMAVAAGCEHSLGLKFGGSIVAWGKNDQGQCSVPPTNSGFISLAAGYYHSLGLKGSQSVVAWGMNSDGQSSVLVPNRGFQSVAGGGFHSLALADTGRLWVTLTPAEAIAAGAKWRIAGEAAWRESGTTVTCPIGNVTVEFLNDLKGWYTLTPTQTVGILPDHLSTASGIYLAGQTWNLSATSGEQGSVSVSPSKTNYLDGSTVVLTAAPDPWYRFTGWSGDVTTTTNPLTLTMDSNKTVTAHFEPDGYPLTLVADPANGGRVSGTPNQPYYHAGDKVTVDAAANLGFWFRGWWDGATTVSKATSFEYTLPASSATLTARFKPFPPEPSVPTVLSFKINNGLTTTINPAVTLANVCADATSVTHSYMASESADFTSATWQPYASVPLFMLSPEAGTKTVYFKVKDNEGV